MVINFSAQTSSNSLQDTIEGRLEKRTKGVFAPTGGKKLVRVRVVSWIWYAVRRLSCPCRAFSVCVCVPVRAHVRLCVYACITGKLVIFGLRATMRAGAVHLNRWLDGKQGHGICGFGEGSQSLGQGRASVLPCLALPGGLH